DDDDDGVVFHCDADGPPTGAVESEPLAFDKQPTGMRSTADDDVEMRSLLSQVAEGNQAAFETLYRSLSQRIFAFVRRGVDNRALAEEIMMDTLFDVWKSAGQFCGIARVSSWVLGIARNKMLMTLRRNKQWEPESEDIEDFADVLDSGSLDGVVDSLEAKQRQLLLNECMRRLPWTYRECLHLLYFEEYSVAEIAELLGIPSGTVKSRLFHARRRLRVCCDELGLIHA
ncbi:MAG: sigma-70 family RNA polymerase sigma factor, partial [Azoarcus sp.]|nr:sigma-70 family RNA polymerase sigma factor [Azoarcus sp.]